MTGRCAKIKDLMLAQWRGIMQCLQRFYFFKQNVTLLTATIRLYFIPFLHGRLSLILIYWFIKVTVQQAVLYLLHVYKYYYLSQITMCPTCVRKSNIWPIVVKKIFKYGFSFIRDYITSLFNTGSFKTCNNLATLLYIVLNLDFGSFCLSDMML